ncbi:MAG TPA: lipoyl synthase [candidate division Zixibacteria bacterium]|nr:lipoyl synthase [candidate division Zixibacteria bacterium]MDD4916381.1 lipoyl synthase [candidate division Zixibacteria bacterium]MDM7972841.1 lipoyl synthase [candidate division Zixibacteria bacterium]HOD67678.1 lipoyl synthase [candidate division Zixibacteria bacterium]HPM37686.1 lipoyl synthase [candidate division Zixibacteria bacterium]
MQKVFFTQSVGDRSAHAPSPQAPPRRERAMVPGVRLPRWMKTRAGYSPNYDRIKNLLVAHGLHTVCQEAACPNIRECWEGGTATFMILGKYCTRGCNFCDVQKALPTGLDEDEPNRVAAAVAQLNLKQVVITSVTRDDLPDGGASIFARTIEALRRQDSDVKVEFLIPDFRGNLDALAVVLASGVDVLAHNVETVQRLYKRVRPGMKLDRSLEILRTADRYRPRPVVKTGFMVGLGETGEEIRELLEQIYAAGCDIVTIGQYLRPSPHHLPIERFYAPEEFAEMAALGRAIGFGHVEAGPLVRSSYKAFEQSRRLLEQSC